MEFRLKETRQFVAALFATMAQAIISFADGVQLKDAADFVDEGLSWDGAVSGFKEGFPAEAAVATEEDVEEMFNEEAKKLTDAGLNPMLVGIVKSACKTAYYGTALAIQNRVEVVSKKAA